MLKDWHPENPGAETIAIGSHKRVKWRCNECDAEWEQEPRYKAEESGCPMCVKKSRAALKEQITGKKQQQPGLMKDVRPDLVAQYDPENEVPLEEVTHGSKYKAAWICKDCGHKWLARVCNRVLKNNGCPTVECQRKTRAQRKAAKVAALKELRK